MVPFMSSFDLNKVKDSTKSFVYFLNIWLFFVVVGFSVFLAALVFIAARALYS